MAFFKKSKSFLKLWFIAFLSLGNKPLGSKLSAAGGLHCPGKKPRSRTQEKAWSKQGFSNREDAGQIGG